MGLVRPIHLKRVQLVDMATKLFLVSNGARGRGADLNKRFFHFEDDHTDHLGWVLRLVEEIGHIGGDDIAGS